MRFADAYECWTKKRLTQIDAARLPGGCPRTFRRTINRFGVDCLASSADGRAASSGAPPPGALRAVFKRDTRRR